MFKRPGTSQGFWNDKVSTNTGYGYRQVQGRGQGQGQGQGQVKAHEQGLVGQVQGQGPGPGQVQIYESVLNNPRYKSLFTGTKVLSQVTSTATGNTHTQVQEICHRLQEWAPMCLHLDLCQ